MSGRARAATNIFFALKRPHSATSDPLVDVSDGDDGAPQANKAMSLKAEVDAAIWRLVE